MTDIARQAAPEIDRLVLGVNAAVDAAEGERLGALAAERDLDSPELILQVGDFLMAGALTRDLALLRMRYSPPERVLARLDEWVTKGLAVDDGESLAATARFRPVFEALFAGQVAVTAAAWGAHARDVAAVDAAAKTIAENVTDDHVVAAVHWSLPETADPHLRLYNRLVTLRYVRQHQHAAAWTSRGLGAAEMPAFTALWRGKEPKPDDAAVVASLTESGLVESGPGESDSPALTPSGRELRDAIEGDTDAAAGRAFSVLDDDTAAGFIAALRRLPSPS